MKELTKKKIEYFVEKGVMSWTVPGDPITYASALVITQKGPDDIRITADYCRLLQTPWGNLTNNTLGQGFITSQDEFDRYMNEVVGDIQRVKANRDDCLIGGLNWKDHNKTLNIVLERIKSYNLTLNKKKCEFGKPEIEFFGVVFNSQGIKPSEKK